MRRLLTRAARLQSTRDESAWHLMAQGSANLKAEPWLQMPWLSFGCKRWH